MTAVATWSAPELSVVLVTDSFATIRKTLRCFQAQGDPARLEIVIAALAGARLAPDAPEAQGFPHLRIVPVDTAIDLARAEALAWRAATAPFVVFAESCAYPRPGFVDAIIGACRSETWAVVGPSMANANPDSATSWAAMWINNTPWLHADQRDPAALLPGHNSAYARPALLSLGNEADDLMRSLSALQNELRARGHQFFLEPAACAELLNVSRPTWYLIDQFGKGRQFATLRCRRWSIARRLLYAAATPLIPVVRLARILAALHRRGRVREVWQGLRLAGLVAGLTMSTAGEFVGYLFGGPAPPGFFERNLHRPQYVRPEDRRCDADESTWPG